MMTNANTFTPFLLESLNKGRLVQEINLDLAKLQDDMLAFAKRFGAEAEKAKGVLTLKMSVICVDPNASQFALKVETTTTSPKRPADVAVAFRDTDDDGKEKLIVRVFSQREDAGPKLPFSEATAPGETVGPGGEVIPAR